MIVVQRRRHHPHPSWWGHLGAGRRRALDRSCGL